MQPGPFARPEEAIHVVADPRAVDPELIARLAAAGVDPERWSDASAAWRRLFERFGRGATLTDRLALEAAARSVDVDDLPAEVRERLAGEVLAAWYPDLRVSGRVRGDPVEIVPWDPGWPERFARWRRRIRDAVGEAALRIEHVGSTAVPGLAAKPVVDVQVSVPAVEDEGAYVPGIEAIGVPLRSREEGHRYFRHPPGRPRLVHVHVCQAGGEWERVHLLFRDYLRAHPQVARAYADLKAELAARHATDRLAYLEGKSGFIRDALAAAERWAGRAGWSVGTGSGP